MQLHIDWNVCHTRENNPASQTKLDLRREDFNSDVWNVLKSMMVGNRLTTKGAMLTGLSGHLPRRIKDCVDGFGVNVSKSWVCVNGKKSHLEYYLTDAEISKVKNKLINKLK